MRIRVLCLSFALLALSACVDRPAPQVSQAPVRVQPQATGPATAAPAGAAPVSAGADVEAEKAVAEQVKVKFPNLKVVSVERVAALASPALYQVTLSDRIAYTNNTVDFFFVGGELVVGSGPQMQNVTKTTALAVGNKLYQSLPIDRAFKYVYGDGSREAVIFTDPDCPYCQQLELLMRENASNLNATIYVLPYPLDALHPNASAKARYIACTKDPQAAWQSWMLTAAATSTEAAQQAAWPVWTKSNPATPNCAQAAGVDANVKFGHDLGVNQTPTIMFKNGMPWYGILSRTELEQAWDYVKANPIPPSSPQPQK
jgi:thiol:disulfide interchange protein DsbC